MSCGFLDVSSAALSMLVLFVLSGRRCPTTSFMSGLIIVSMTTPAMYACVVKLLFFRMTSVMINVMNGPNRPVVYNMEPGSNMVWCGVVGMF